MRAVATWGLMLGLCGLTTPVWATPPAEPPEPAGEAPLVPAPAPGLEPVTIPVPVPAPEPVPPEPDSEPQLPAYDQPLPSYDEAPVAPDVSFDGVPIELEDPPTGRGRTAFGAILLGGGATLTGVSATMIRLDTDLAAWIPGAVIGSAALITGVTLIATGHLRQKRYRAWAKTHADAPVPARGDGLLAGGVTCMIAGTMGTIIGGVSILSFQDEDDPPYGQVMVPLVLASVVTGVGLLVAGGKRRKQFDRWKAGTVSPSLSLLPGTRQSIGGLSLGFAGRF
jgi:hypothetical protein